MRDLRIRGRVLDLEKKKKKKKKFDTNQTIMSQSNNEVITKMTLVEDPTSYSGCINAIPNEGVVRPCELSVGFDSEMNIFFG